MQSAADRENLQGKKVGRINIKIGLYQHWASGRFCHWDKTGSQSFLLASARPAIIANSYAGWQRVLIEARCCPFFAWKVKRLFLCMVIVAGVECFNSLNFATIPL